MYFLFSSYFYCLCVLVSVYWKLMSLKQIIVCTSILGIKALSDSDNRSFRWEFVQRQRQIIFSKILHTGIRWVAERYNSDNVLCSTNRYFIVLHTGIVWDADSFSFCWLICCHSSDAECVIDSSSQTSDVIGVHCWIYVVFSSVHWILKKSLFPPGSFHVRNTDDVVMLFAVRFLITSGSVWERKVNDM